MLLLLDAVVQEFHPPGQELIEATAEVKSCFYIRAGAIECLAARRPGKSFFLHETTTSSWLAAKEF